MDEETLQQIRNQLSVPALTLAARAEDYDPLLDKSYKDTLLGKHVADWLVWMELGGAAKRTLDQYERDLSRVCHLYPNKGIADFSDGDLLHVIRSWPQKSRRVRKAAIDSFFRWAIKCRRLEKNPMDLLPVIKRTPQRYIDTFSDAEVAALTSLDLIDRALMLILLDAGLRKGEARNLRVDRCKLDTSEIVIIGGKGDKDRVIPIGGKLLSTLAELFVLEGIGSRAFIWYSRPGGGAARRDRPIGEGSFDRWWRRCVVTAGVRYRNPHTTRHSFATRWLRRGGRLETLSVAMGHSSIRTTFDQYGHLDTSDVAADLALVLAGGAINPDSDD